VSSTPGKSDWQNSVFLTSVDDIKKLKAGSLGLPIANTRAFELVSLAILSGLASPWRTARLSSFPNVKGAAPRVPRSRLIQHFHLAVIF